MHYLLSLASRGIIGEVSPNQNIPLPDHTGQDCLPLPSIGLVDSADGELSPVDPWVGAQDEVDVLLDSLRESRLAHRGDHRVTGSPDFQRGGKVVHCSVPFLTCGSTRSCHGL